MQEDKAMSCRQLGGPCDVVHRADNANEIIKAQDRHLRAAVAAGGTDHEDALEQMKGRWRRPVSGMRWYRQVLRDFDGLEPVNTTADQQESDES